ncbi:MAG: GNAT family N-acetyltransferase [Actinomycetaceae bacterium]|nr:GNAT family N-acetyltransferase [Actinomycetaceae bacterium]
MPIVEMSAADVSAWVPHAVEHMARVRVASGALPERLASDYIARTRSLFRVGVPKDSRILTCPDTGDWMWLRTGGEPEIVGHRVTGSHRQWADRALEAAGCQPVALTLHPGEGGLSEVAHREISVQMSVAIPDLHLNRNYDDIYVRPMSAVELDTFLEHTKSSASRHLEAAAGSCTRHSSWDVMARARSRLTDGLATPGHALLSICVDTTTIGGIWAEVDGRNARVWNVYVYEGYRGHGHSRAALLAAADGLKNEGVKYMNVSVMSPNKAAIAIYESVGFTQISRQVVIEPQAA